MDVIAKIIFLISRLYTLIAPKESHPELTVQLSNGAVQGETILGERGNIIYSFKGIPFAEPPTGDLRFQPPVPKRPWKDILIANKYGPLCSQLLFLGEEDCLYLNVFAPKPPNSDNIKLNVIYFIHGGGFLSGGSSTFGSERFYLDDIILVTVNYRLAVPGFLSTNDSSASGNYGQLDQTEGLKWVRNNIHHFGGDPNKVTIMGASSGSASVIYHMLSPLSEGLFHRAIAMSGSSLCSWALQKDPLYWANKLGSDVNCPTNSSIQLIECLRQKSAIELSLKGLILDRNIPILNNAPTVDNYFIHDLPLNIIKNGKFHKNVSLIIGTTKDEGNCWVSDNSDLSKEGIEALLTITVEALPNVENKIKLVKEKYIGNLTSDNREELLERLRSAVTDGAFQKNIFRTAIEMIKSGTETYFYRYDYKMPNSTSNAVCHGDDARMFFITKNNKLDPQSQMMSDRLQKLFINFAKYGKPTLHDEITDCEWPASNLDPFNRLIFYHININCSIDVYDAIKDPLYEFWTKEIEEVS